MRFILVLLGVILPAFGDNENYIFDTRYIEVPLDHFSFTNNQTFQLRYFVNESYFKKDGPIFFYAGNEGDLNMFAQNTGFMFDIAPRFGALIVFAEHRYYGKSMPFGNLSYTAPDYLGYLSSTQALADFVYLIDDLQKTYSTPNKTKIPAVAFGGSYGGMLAAYLRMKYPYAVIGAIASSAPIYQYPYLTDCGSFHRTVTRTFNTIGGEKCGRAISDSWSIIRNVSSTEAGRTNLVKKWKLCAMEDAGTLTGWLTSIYEFLAEMNYPYATDFMLPLPANPVLEFCDHIKENYTDDTELLEDLGRALQIYVNYTGTVECIDLQQTASDQLGVLGWGFQTCTDMIQYICSTDDDMFENYDFNYDGYVENCRRIYGVQPRSIDVPLLEYGGKELSHYSNIIFSNGLLDPWSGLGVLQNISSTVLAYHIPDGAHHVDLRASHDNDTLATRVIRMHHVENIYRWLDEYHREHNVTNFEASQETIN